MQSISRRVFLGGSAALLAALRHPPAFAAAAKPPDLVDVHGQDPSAMVAAALSALGGMKAFVKKGDTVVLKPNASFANPSDWGTTTHPEIVTAVAKACLDAGAKKVVVVEFPLSNPEKCLERCGLAAALKTMPDVGLQIIGAAEHFSAVKIPGATVLETVDVAKAVLSSDVLINLPVAKAHKSSVVSFGLKNAMGLIKDRRALHKLGLDAAIVDINRVIKPQLTLLDATRCLVTNGPGGPGETVRPGRIVAGRSVVSVDAYGLGLARFNERDLTVADVKHIQLAGEAGLGETDIAKLKVRKVEA